MPIRALDKATPVINKINTNAKKPVSKTVNISPNYTGVWHKVLTVTKHEVPGGYTGLNNKISYHHVPVTGSLARGTKKGRVGPRNQGGLTLTGEEGYEVAWIPSENRSAILGASGPEMVNLPKEAVVYNHEQSKEIMKKRQGISAGSMISGSATYTPGSSTPAPKTSKKKTRTTSNKTSKTSKPSKTQKAPSLTAETAALSNVIVWWENIARRAEAVQRQADKNQKAYEKYLKNIQATLKTTGTTGQGNAFIANTNSAIARYTEELNQATKELKNMDQGTDAQRKSWTTADKNDNVYATKNAFYAEQGGAVQISYSTGSGKKKKTINKIVGTAGYITAQDGTYVIDQTKLNQISNKEERKALADALNKEINDRISKRNKAEDDIEKAREALEKFGEELYNTFFKWETELTKIWNLTQKIERSEANISRIKGYQELLNNQLATGLATATEEFSQKTLEAFRIELTEQSNKINQQAKLLAERQQAVTDAFSILDEQATLANIEEKLKEPLNATEKLGYQQYQKELQNQIAAAGMAQKYLSVTQRADGTMDIDFNNTQFEQDKQNGLLTEETAKAIQDYVKKIEEATGDLNGAYNNLQDELNSMHDNLSQLQDQWADYANELWDISEAEQKQSIDNAKQISDSITDALKDLLDEVKNKLEERRQQEDNAKTERDISQKQQQLAALRANTAGGNQLQIAQLEQEIAEAQQNYGRTLEDQMLDKLQQQADLASKQRERQIEIQELIASEVNNAAEVNKWMSDPKTYRKEIYEAYKAANDYDKKPLALQQQIDRNFETLMEGLLNNQTKQAELVTGIQHLEGITQAISDSIKNMTEITSTRSVKQLQQAGFDNQTIKAAGHDINDFREAGISNVSDLKSIGFSLKDMREAGYNLNDVKGDYTLKQIHDAGYSAQDVHNAGYSYNTARDAGYSISELQNLSNYQGQAAGEQTIWNQIKQAVKTIGPGSTKGPKISPINGQTAVAVAKRHGNENIDKELYNTSAKLDFGLSNDGYIYFHDGKGNIKSYNPNTGAITKPYSFNEANFRKYAGIGTNWQYANVGGKNPLWKWAWKEAYEALKYKFPKKYSRQYKTGGLADYTGPAWLDGTPSKPELVLNATDTKNFMALKDVLSRAMSSSSQINNSYGGNATYEININVDHLNNDYDVDKVVERVKKKIVSDSGYRNVTQVRKFR